MRFESAHRAWTAGLLVSALVAVLGLVGCGSGSHKSAAAAHPAQPCSAFKAAKPKNCISSTGMSCERFVGTTKPADCYSPAQLRAVRRAERIAAAQQKAAEKRAAKAAAAHAAYVAAANVWHKGYFQQNANVFWKWRDGGSCQDYVTNGCWHVAVITRYGCSSYVAVNANEYRGNTIVNQLLDNQGYGIPQKTVRVFELDADAGGVTASDVSVDCE